MSKEIYEAMRTYFEGLEDDKQRDVVTITRLLMENKSLKAENEKLRRMIE